MEIPLKKSRDKCETAKLIGVKWRSFGCYTKISDDILDTIEQDNKTTLEKAYQVVNIWSNVSPNYEDLRYFFEKEGKMDAMRKFHDITSSTYGNEKKDSFDFINVLKSQQLRRNLADRLGINWMFFGLYLNFEDHDINKISTDQKTTNERAYEIIKKSIEKNSTDDDFVSALEFVNRRDLVNDITKIINSTNAVKQESKEEKGAFKFSGYDAMNQKSSIIQDDQQLIIDKCLEDEKISLDDIPNIDKHYWEINIKGMCCDNQVNKAIKFFPKFFSSGRNLKCLNISTIEISLPVEQLIKTVYNNATDVTFCYPFKVSDKWIPTKNISNLVIDVKKHLITKEQFNSFMPWINVCKTLSLFLHEKTDFVKDICKSIKHIKFEVLLIHYRENYFHYYDDFKCFVQK